MLITIDNVIYFYLFICFALLAFNAFYIFQSKGRDRKRRLRVRRWERSLLEEMSRPDGGLNTAHQVLLLRKLRDTEELTAYHEVLSHWQEGRRREMERYFLAYREVFLDLAVAYGKQSSMERAFFAYVIAAYYPPSIGQHDPMTQILIGYMDDSTVYCRENVLVALYALGDGQAVEHAFDILNERDWYHHPRLLSDGMARFSGNKNELVERLWANRKKWADFLTVGTVQFAAAQPECFFAELFLAGLLREALPLEIRFALIRYFGRHFYAEAKPVLLEFMENSGGAENDPAIAAASTLARYPGADTLRALKTALHSRNWYVRHNAAGSLVTLGITSEEVEEIRASGDRYALEMLEYMAGYEPEPAGVELPQEKAMVLV